MWTTLGLSCLWFTEILKPIALCQQIWGVSNHISLNTCSVLSFSLSFGNSNGTNTNFCYCPTSSWGVAPFLSVFFLCMFRLNNSIDLSSRSLILSSVISSLEHTHPLGLFSYFIAHLYTYFGFFSCFSNFYLFASTSYVFNNSRYFIIVFWSICIICSLKSFSDNSNIGFISLLTCLSSLIFVIFLGSLIDWLLFFFSLYPGQLYFEFCNLCF